ncbi:Fc.00g043210.m01.CDS01 [Cosmosporella sp. VM-42]
MTSSKNHTARSVLDAFYEAEREFMSFPPEKRDFSNITALISPNFRLEQSSALPYAGVYLGSAGFQDWAKRMADYFDVVDVQNPEIFEKAGSDRIVVLGNLHLRVRATGEELDYPFCQVDTIDLENGKMVKMQPFYWDVADLNRAVGYKPEV